MAEPRGIATVRPIHPSDDQLDVELCRFHADGSALGERIDGAAQVRIRAGRRPDIRWRTPAGTVIETRAWARDVTVYVSPTGRSVRVWVDGQEIPRG